MKQQIFIALIAVLTFASCGTVSFEDDQKEEESQTNNIGTRTVTFSVADIYNEDNATKAALNTAAKERFSYLQYWIYDSNYKNLMAVGEQQTTKDENFGTFTETLAYGTYNVVVIGHNLSSAMELNKSKMIVLGKSDTRLNDTYYGNAECTVEAGKSSTTTITMKRNICNLYVTSKGSASNVGSVNVELNAYGVDFGVKDGLSGSEEKTYSYSIDFTDEMREKIRTHIQVFFPLPANDTEYNTVSARLTALDRNGQTLGTTLIENIPAKIGRKVTYTRNLWGEDASINVVVSEDDWELVDGDKL